MNVPALLPPTASRVMLKHARAGDPSSWRGLFLRERLRIAGVLAHHVRDRVDREQAIESLANDLYRSARARLPALSSDAPAAFAQWIAGAARRRARGGDASTPTAAPASELEPLAPSELRQALAHPLLRAVDSLPPMDRALVILRYFELRPAAEVARALGCNERALRPRLLRACAALNRRLREEECGV